MYESTRALHIRPAIGPAQSHGACDALFPWWSLTKPVIATLALQLAARGRLSLDDALPGQTHSLRQLLGHRSGLPDYGRLPAYQSAVAAGQPAWSRATLESRALAQGPVFPPGTGWSYSNVGYMRVRALLERTTGRPLADLIATEITQPLALTSVTLAETPASFARIAFAEAESYDPNWVGHGCLIGTAPDATRFLSALMSAALIPPTFLDEMTQAHPLGDALPGRPWTRHGYGLGLMIGEIAPSVPALGHSGCGPFSSAALYHFPKAAPPVTLAAFSDRADEAAPECDVARYSQQVDTATASARMMSP